MQPFAEHLRFDWAEATFEEAEAEVRQWGDRQGNGIDPLMIPVVAGLNLLGIRTIQSCEGHLDHGFGYPWVMFERPLCPCYAAEWQACQDISSNCELDAYHASDRLHEAMAACPHRPAEALRLASLLAAFYGTPTPPSARLMIDYTGATFYRLIAVVESGQGEGKEETLARCQAEMRRFASFLKTYCQAREERSASHSRPESLSFTTPLDKSQISR
ncbi:MAG: hypothetical protein IMW89_14735 [Ktedonobacteraceae bacterium]|nr:hypothetical protein [Ktedonobacteraceae bacterium]